MSSDDAAELEELRREAALLREQLENAVGQQGSVRGARDVHQLEARIDSLAARNSKLMETLKEARQQLLALREEVDRLGQPPSGYGVLLSTHDDNTVDVFTSGRKMRLTCSPNIDVKSLKKGQTVRLNEALTVVEAGNFESVGEISTLREILADGHRALVVGHADEERIVWLAEPLVAENLPDGVPDALNDDTRPRKLRPGTRCWWTPRPATPSSASPRRKSKTWCSKRCPMSATTTSAGSPGRSSRSATRSSCRSCTRSCTRNTRCAHPRACCSTARPAAARR
ncbi:proteasome-associated ATPase domain protein [Mycobacterium xenopi 4042]|uniref:Proteasome-associated ATPase domain protein n=1 Tax=Mycobacterium xenopi 4042 TaxID=1299334 RepID=X8BE54_MYCXE|nr:proteasome-associated ATPase domain protein [Mycobacterium xenopi 4042]EUA44384.1 proteasome-associated ATPase domain protein [Mycobacterium xenopi 3993]